MKKKARERSSYEEEPTVVFQRSYFWWDLFVAVG